MTTAIKPSDKLAMIAARNAELFLSLTPIEYESLEKDDERREGLKRDAPRARFLALKTLDAEWTGNMLALLGGYPEAADRFAGLPLRGRRADQGEMGPFHRELYDLLERHNVSAVFLSRDGAFCPLRLEPLTPEVAVGDRYRRGRWMSAALCERPNFAEDFRRYMRRLAGAKAKDCCRAHGEQGRVVELEALKKQEGRIRQLVSDCCGERRAVSRLYRRRATEVQPPQTSIADASCRQITCPLGE